MTIALLWDLDGVLADTGEAHYAAWQALYAERGETITREEFEAGFGMSNGPILRERLGADTPESVILSMGDRKEELYRQMLAGNVCPLPGVSNWLERAKQSGYRQVVASSGPMANIVAVIDALGISDYFCAIVSGSLLPRSKPDPAIFLQAAAAAGVTPERCLVIEDGVVGVEAASSAGIRCLAVTTTHTREKLAGADLIVESLAEIDLEGVARLLSLF